MVSGTRLAPPRVIFCGTSVPAHPQDHITTEEWLIAPPILVVHERLRGQLYSLDEIKPMMLERWGPHPPAGKAKPAKDGDDES